MLFELSTGYTFRDALSETSAGKVGVIQAGDINANRLNSIPRVQLDNQRHLLKPGDILVSARGNVAARTVTQDILPAVAASSVFVLRPISENINPRFIARYLNSKSGQDALRQIKSGAYIKSLRISDLGSLQVPVPPGDIQNKIVALHDTIERQQNILHQKSQLLERLDSTVINQIQGESS